ncbi:nitroreductase family protein [Bacteroidota bacterium]
MELDDLADIIKSRRSIRLWQDREVSESLLLQAIGLATWAPNGGNKQNWHFYVILNRDIIKAIADAVQTRADQIADWPEAQKFEDAARKLQRSGLFRNAPAAIAVAAAQYQSEVDLILAAREKVDSQAGQIRQWRNICDTRIQSVASAIAYLLLVLHQLGLGAVWMTGPMQAKEEIEKILNIPPEMDIIAFIPVGYPDESPVPKKRRPLKEVCEVVRY